MLSPIVRRPFAPGPSPAAGAAAAGSFPDPFSCETEADAAGGVGSECSAVGSRDVLIALSGGKFASRFNKQTVLDSVDA